MFFLKEEKNSNLENLIEKEVRNVLSNKKLFLTDKEIDILNNGKLEDKLKLLFDIQVLCN